MTPTGIRERIVAERAAWIRTMLSGMRALPLDSLESFRADPRNPAAAESFLRRALEALLDLGRHLLSKGLGIAVVEYKEIAGKLASEGVLAGELATLMRDMAGYRNRMVHFYDEVDAAELYHLATDRLGDIEHALDAILSWIDDHPGAVERS